MLAAMARGARTQYANRVDLMSAGTWVVPAGVTSVNVFAATRGGTAASLAAWGYGAAAGGGGGAIYDCALTVIPGNTVGLTTNVLTHVKEFAITDTTAVAVLFLIETGWNATGGGILEGGRGAQVEWRQGGITTAARGAAGSGAGGNGGNGQRVTVAGGSILSGGGGGAPGLLVPQGTGGNGGASDTFAGISGNQPNGGAGGGLIPGQYALANSFTYVPSGFSSDGFCFLEWN